MPTCFLAMLGGAIFHLTLSAGFAYAGFKSFKTLRSLRVADSADSAVPIDDGNSDCTNDQSVKLWLQFWVSVGLARSLSHIVDSRLDFQVMLVACLCVQAKSRELIAWIYTTFSEPVMQKVDIHIIPIISAYSSQGLSRSISTVRSIHTSISRCSLQTLTSEELDKLEKSLQDIAVITTAEKRKRRIEDFKKSQKQLAYRTEQANSNDILIPTAPASRAVPFLPTEINLDEDNGDNANSSANDLRRRAHRGSKIATSRSRQTIGVSPYA